jgi:AraC-like DNA-binding protein
VQDAAVAGRYVEFDHGRNVTLTTPALPGRSTPASSGAARSPPWTVAKLAANAGVSRAALARRFTPTVGEAPMTYLTGWRLALAADLLRQRPELTIGAVARQVGYGSSFALSTAFKRAYGRSPQAYRTRT